MHAESNGGKGHLLRVTVLETRMYDPYMFKILIRVLIVGYMRWCKEIDTNVHRYFFSKMMQIIWHTYCLQKLSWLLIPDHIADVITSFLACQTWSLIQKTQEISEYSIFRCTAQVLEYFQMVTTIL